MTKAEVIKHKGKMVTVTAAVACVALIIVLFAVIIPNEKYKRAAELCSAGKYDEAIAAFETLDGYKDSGAQIENCYIGKFGEETWNRIKNIKAGDTYTFGTYEQDNDTSDGKEAIDWIVLDKDGFSLLLVSDKALDCKMYDPSTDDMTWENCSLRQWLNSTFLNEAFSVEEQSQISTTIVSADKNPQYSTNPGNATTDRVFLLSITEAETYFLSEEDRMCVPTAYAIAQGGAADGYWWLRTPGQDSLSAAVVLGDGSVSDSGDYVFYGDDCVRPALWINLDAE